MAEQTPTVQQLCDAAQAGDLAQVEEILAQNALLARQPITQNGQLAIQFAAREGYAEIVAALLAAGADPQRGVYPNRRATSALAYARARGYYPLGRGPQRQRRSGAAVLPLRCVGHGFVQDALSAVARSARTGHAALR